MHMIMPSENWKSDPFITQKPRNPQEFLYLIIVTHFANNYNNKAFQYMRTA